MSMTAGSDSGSVWSGIAADVTQLGLAYGASRLIDVQPTGVENVNGVEVPYYGVAPAATSSASSSAGTLILIGAVVLAAFLLLKR